MLCTIHFDGSCNPNPNGDAKGGWVLDFEDGSTIRGSQLIAKNSTNNVAEFGALECAIDHAKGRGATELNILGDSKLVVCCVRGEYKCKKKHLKEFLVRIKQKLQRFKRWDIGWVPREANGEADRISVHGHLRTHSKTQPGFERTGGTQSRLDDCNHDAVEGCGVRWGWRSSGASMRA